jgi:hypothetical protein
MGADISLLKMSMNICCVGGKQFGDRTELLMLYDNNCRMGGEKQIGE